MEVTPRSRRTRHSLWVHWPPLSTTKTSTYLWKVRAIDISWLETSGRYSHSMVPGGLLVMS